MQTQAQNLLEGFLSIYDFNQTINIPYQQKNSVEKSIFQHWNITGGYLKMEENLDREALTDLVEVSFARFLLDVTRLRRH